MNRMEKYDEAIRKTKRRKKIAKVKDVVFVGLNVMWIAIIIISIILDKSNMITEETSCRLGWITFALIAICSCKWWIK